MNKRLTWICPWCPIQNPQKAATAITVSILQKKAEEAERESRHNQEGRR